MRIFITGGGGFVGAHTALALLEAGHEVRLLLRDPTVLERFYAPLGHSDIELVQGCMTDPATVNEGLSGVDAVVHAAAVVGLDASSAEYTYDTNLRGVELVVGGACEHGIQNVLHVSSSAALYAPGASVLDELSPIGSSRNAYGRSKVDAEHFARALQEKGAPVQITYPAGIVGPDDPKLSEGNNALRLFLNLFVLLTRTGIQYVDVRDLAQVHCRLLERGCPDAPTGARYMVGGTYLPWATFADTLEAASRRSVRRLPAPAALLRACGIICDQIKRVIPFRLPITHEAMTYVTGWVPIDSQRVQQELGVEFRDVSETIADSVRWLEEAGHLPAKRS